ncbi:MAG: hypothetical protein WC971_04955 [Coriobacteriia bacterium]
MGSGLEFPVTHGLIAAMGGWVNKAAQPLLPAVRVSTETGFEWRLEEETPRALVVCKAVRVASGLNAAVVLLDAGMVTETAALMRIVSDLATEMVAICEGGMREKPTQSQEDFVRQFFDRAVAGTVNYAARRRYVGRDELLKAHDRLAAGVGLSGKTFSDLTRAVNFALDGYVHGSYSSTMELYHGGRDEFMVSGHEGIDEIPIYRLNLALATHEALVAFGFMATNLGDVDLKGQIEVALDALNLSGKQES